MTTRRGPRTADGKRAALYLVRHGQTDWNLDPVRCQGRSDVPLNDRGREQAHELGRRLAGRGIDLIVTSHLARARETAELVRDELDRDVATADADRDRPGADVPATAAGTRGAVELRLDERLAETDRGDWEGRLFGDIAREDAAAWQEYKDHPETFTFPGGESFAAQQHRVLAAVRDAALTRRVALLVTHGGSIRLLRAFLEGRGIESFHDMTVPNGDVLEVDDEALPRRIETFLSPPAFTPGTG